MGICDQAVRSMFEILWTILIYPRSLLRSQHELAMEVLARRHQITVLKRPAHRPKLRPWDRGLWMILKRAWPNWKAPLILFRPETVIGWQRAGFKMFWRWKSRRRSGRPGKDAELIRLIRPMWAVNPPGTQDSSRWLTFFTSHLCRLSPLFLLQMWKCKISTPR